MTYGAMDATYVRHKNQITSSCKNVGSGEDDCVTVGNRVWRLDPALDAVDPMSIADTFTVIPQLNWPHKTREVQYIQRLITFA